MLLRQGDCACRGIAAHETELAPAVSTCPEVPRASADHVAPSHCSKSPTLAPAASTGDQMTFEAPAVSTCPVVPLGSVVQKPGPGTACHTNKSPVAVPEGSVAPPPPPPVEAMVTSTQSLPALSAIVRVTFAPATKFTDWRVPLSVVVCRTRIFCTEELSRTAMVRSAASEPPPVRPYPVEIRRVEGV